MQVVQRIHDRRAFCRHAVYSLQAGSTVLSQILRSYRREDGGRGWESVVAMLIVWQAVFESLFKA